MKPRLYLISRTIKYYKEDRQKAYNDITTYTYPIKIKDVVWLQFITIRLMLYRIRNQYKVVTLYVYKLLYNNFLTNKILHGFLLNFSLTAAFIS